MTQRISRREAIKKTVAGGIAASTLTLHRPRALAANEKLNIAAIGTANRAGANIKGCASQNIVALADIDSNFLDQAASTYSGARKYRDYRVMLEKESEKIDAVIVGTPDHSHAPAAAMALRMGKHVYCEKPLTHTVLEARTLATLASERNLVTQMGTQIHAGDNYRRVVEMVQSGTIGAIREAHVWVGVNYSESGFTTTQSKPKHVDWDLWLGPAPRRPYSEAIIASKAQTVHPFHWRWFWDYGTGGLGDFGCHYMDLTHWALKLKHPNTVHATGPTVKKEGTSAGIVVKYEYPARESMPPVSLTWYDGGKKPEILKTLKDRDGKPLNWGSGQLFVGEKGMIISNYGNHVVVGKGGADLKRPDPYIPSSIGHHNEWIEAIKSSGTTTCNFDYSGSLTEAVLLGVVSYRSGEMMRWDAKNLKVKNSSKAQAMIHKEYRKGWTL